MAPVRSVGLLMWLVILLHSSARLIEAAATVSFQFLAQYASIQSDVVDFTSQLTNDLRTKYGFTSQHIDSIQVTSSPSDRIQVNFELDIDTRNSTLVTRRDRLKEDLLAPNYIFLFTNSTGGRETFLVDSGSASLVPSFRDGWHQYAPDIFYATLVGLALIALFSTAVYCLIKKQRTFRQKYLSDRTSTTAPSAGHVLNGYGNDGYITEMTQVYRIKNTEASPIPHPPSTSIEAPISIIMPSSLDVRGEEVPQPDSSHEGDRPPDHRSITTPESLSPSIARTMVPMYESSRPSNSRQGTLSSLPRRSQQPDGSSVRDSVTPTENQLDHAVKQPASSKMSPLQGSVRSSIFGLSTTSTPSSSRRPSITGPSIYARLLYSSYSVPPKKIYNYI